MCASPPSWCGGRRSCGRAACLFGLGGGAPSPLPSHMIRLRARLRAQGPCVLSHVQILHNGTSALEGAPPRGPALAWRRAAAKAGLRGGSVSLSDGSGGDAGPVEAQPDGAPPWIPPPRWPPARGSLPPAARPLLGGGSEAALPPPNAEEFRSALPGTPLALHGGALRSLASHPPRPRWAHGGDSERSRSLRGLTPPQ